MQWISDSLAPYVFAAYGVAGIALTGLAIVSWLGLRRTLKAGRSAKT